MDQEDETEEIHGNRILTAFIYLNDVEDGGCTAFPELNLTVTPKLGRLVLWPSVLNTEPTEIDWRTVHESLPVVNGTKYGVNIWFRYRPFRTGAWKYTCDDSPLSEIRTDDDRYDETDGLHDAEVEEEETEDNHVDIRDDPIAAEL